MRSVPAQNVSGCAQNSDAVELPLKRSETVNLMILLVDPGANCQQLVTQLDSRLVRWPARGNALRGEHAALLHPPGAIIRSGILAFFLEINDRKDDRSGGHQCQSNGRYP